MSRPLEDLGLKPSEGAGAALGTARAFLAAAEKRLKIEMRRLA